MRIIPARSRYESTVFHDQNEANQSGREHIRDFFDRVEIQEKIISALAADQAVVLKGERRSGKSSLLLRIGARLKSESEQKIVHLQITQGEVKAIQSYSDFVNKLVQVVGQVVNVIPAREFNDAKERTPEIVTAFLVEVLADFQGMILLTIDELDAIFESIAQEDERRAVADLLILLVRASTTGADLPLKMIFSTIFMPAYLDAARVLFQSPRITPFSIAEHDELLSWIFGADAAELNEQDRQRCYQLTGGWPFFLKWLCDEANSNEGNKHEGNLSPGWPDRAMQDGLNNLHNTYVKNATLDNYTKNFTPREQTILILLAKTGKLQVETLTLLGKPYQDAVNLLVKRGYVIETAAGVYKLRIGILEAWFHRWEKLEVETRKLCSLLPVKL